MSNIFKNKNSTNNRFNFLDDSEIIKDKKEKKNDEREINKNNYLKNNDAYHDERTDNYNEFKLIENKKNKKRFNEEKIYIFKKPIEESVIVKEINILEYNFPDLSNNKSNILEVPKFESEKIYKNLFDVKEEDKDDFKVEEEFIPDGCICISYDKNNRKINYKQGKMSTSNNKVTIQQVIDNMAQFIEKRKNDYINLWGLNTYEDTFLFKNYDYEYFDKLDIQYEIEMEKLNEEIELEEQLKSIDDYYY